MEYRINVVWTNGIEQYINMTLAKICANLDKMRELIFVKYIVNGSELFELIIKNKTITTFGISGYKPTDDQIRRLFYNNYTMRHFYFEDSWKRIEKIMPKNYDDHRPQFFRLLYDTSYRKIIINEALSLEPIFSDMHYNVIKEELDNPRWYHYYPLFTDNDIKRLEYYVLQKGFTVNLYDLFV